MQRVFSGGASAGLPAQALGLSLHGSELHFLLKMDSSLGVKSHQRKTPIPVIGVLLWYLRDLEPYIAKQ